MTQVPRRDSYRYQSQLAAGSGLTYLNPLVMTRLACIFRRSQSDAPRGFIDTIQRNRSVTKFKRSGANLLGWFEFRVGPYFISLNRA